MEKNQLLIKELEILGYGDDKKKIILKARKYDLINTKSMKDIGMISPESITTIYKQLKSKYGFPNLNTWPIIDISHAPIIIARVANIVDSSKNLSNAKIKKKILTDIKNLKHNQIFAIILNINIGLTTTIIIGP